MIIKVAVCNPNEVVQLEPWALFHNRQRYYLSQPARVDRVGTQRLDRERFINPNMLLVCKQIYKEGAPLMYSGQKFHFPKLAGLQTFLLPLRPQTLDLIRWVQVDVAEKEWPLMPAMAHLFLQLRFIEHLEISGLGKTTGFREIGRYLRETDRPVCYWPVTIESFDKIRGIKLARDTYPFMYPLYNPVIRAKPSPFAHVPRNQKLITDFLITDEGLDTSDSEDEAAAGPVSPVTYKKAEIVLENRPDEPLEKHAGLAKLLKVIHFVELERRPRWYTGISYPAASMNTGFYGWWAHMHDFDQFKNKLMTDKRRATMMTAMGEELVRMMANDRY